jgi:hypothetical protein
VAAAKRRQGSEIAAHVAGFVIVDPLLKIFRGTDVEGA